MRAGYDALASKILGEPSEKTVVEDPVKRQWALQEGFRPEYNPNADKVTWVPSMQSTPAPNMLRLKASMSPESLAEVYPMFEQKQRQIDGVLTQIYQAAIDGDITHQRAQELAMQLALDTFKEVSDGQKIKGAAAKSSSLEQTFDKASKTNRIAGEE